jgi:hypothetical protein
MRSLRRPSAEEKLGIEADIGAHRPIEELK